METLKDLFSLSKNHKWLILINDNPAMYVNNKKDAEILLATISKKLLSTSNNLKMHILNNHARHILSYENNCMYILKLVKIQKFDKIIHNHRISQIKKHEKDIQCIDEKIHSKIYSHNKFWKKKNI